MDKNDSTITPSKGQFAGLGSLGVGVANTWLRTRAPFRATFKAGSLTGGGIFTPSEGLLKLAEMNKTAVYRNSGTSVDGERREFITPVMANSNYAIKPRSFTDGTLKRRLDLSNQTNESNAKDIDSMRDTVENLSAEMDKQKQVTDTLIVGLNQKFMKEMEDLNCRLYEQELITQKLVADKNSPSLGSLVFLICRTILSWSPFHFIITYLDKEHVHVWMNKCLRYLVSFCLFILFKSWARILGVEERLIQIELAVYKLLRMVFLPFSKRTGSQPPLHVYSKDRVG